MEPTVRIAVVDDSMQDRQAICDQIAAYAAGRRLPWQAQGFPSGDTFLHSWASRRYEAVFLDILMDGMNGMEIARQLRQLDPTVPLIFITCEADYAIAGYEVEAIGFLVKDDTAFPAHFDRLMERLQLRLAGDIMLELPSEHTVIPVPAGSVLYAEVMDHSMHLHLDGSEMTIRMTMGQLRQVLAADPRFFECHRGIIINLDAISALQDQVVIMRSGNRLPVSRRKTQLLRQAYAARRISAARKSQ